jgi:hypothetical protein
MEVEMAELTLEAVREVVEVVVKEEIVQFRREVSDSFDRVLATIQSLTDRQEDELVGVKGRLHHHNERIAQLERLNNLR